MKGSLLSFKPQVYIKDLSRHVGEEVVIKGWLYNSRSSGKILFPQLRDGTGIVQCVVLKSAVSPEVWEALDHLGQESSLVVRGKVREDARAPGGYEIEVTDAEVVQAATGYPITPKEHGVEFLLDHRHLWIRSRRQHAILKVRHTVVRAVRDFLDQEGFILCDAPILTPAACEGTTTLFEVDYFEDEKAYLTQSGQLYNEATAAAFGRVYCFGPTFRAEKSKTRRHLTEFWMVEPEMAYATIDDVMELSERFLTAIVARVLDERREELKLLERDTAKLERIAPPFPRLHYDEAVRILQEGHERGALEDRFEWGGDFGAPDETYLSQQFEKPVMVHRFPAAVKAFYMARDPERPELALGVDVLAPEGYGEIIGGGERAASLEFLEEQIREHNLPREAFEWYLDLRRYGSVPHAGFGMGIERCVAWLCGIEHVRETIPFPRMLYRLRP
ncbi:asparagine--tRNA ligase [Pyrinomonas methylaliphatogenes]|jgi:asparaginyl-tRNA synthetase|uniref:Asparagine--tRNA ligase n=1 Tax=Pyrinomonas methylaliphatogenes TaxID=454194 RepID=A0A0B6WYW0_9BACT|nr:asparagine--tRNA ligase [Pyrinomonas methylaliphatogenes]CDM65340.1 asparaginyl-tRNA synthetase [Pyrinomonas methylaliphatogenes]